MNIFTQKPETRFGRVAWLVMIFNIESRVVPLAPSIWLKPNHIETRLNLEP
jgi:hypothetical protein